MKSNTTFRLTITLSLLALISLSVYGFAFAGWTIGTNTTANVSGTYDSLANGLVAHYTFDGSSVTPTTVADDSGNGNTGTKSGSPKAVLGKIGQGMSFNGSSDYINTSKTQSGSVVAYSVWFKDVNTASIQGIVGYGVNASANGIATLLLNENLYGGVASGSLTFSIRTTSGTYFMSARTGDLSSIWADGNWHYVYAEADLVNKTHRFFLDGVLQSTATTRIDSSLGSISQTLKVGVGNTGGATPVLLDGSIDDVRIYNRALSADEITRLYNMGGSRLGVTPTDSLDAGLVGHWDFDGKNVTSTTVADTSGNGNTGTIVGDTKPALGRIGQGMSFDGNGDYITKSSVSSLDNLQNVTISMWVKPNVAMTTFQRLLTKSGKYALGTQSLFSNKLIFFSITGSSSYWTIDSLPSVGVWTHIVVTQTGIQTPIIYYNGVAQTATVRIAPTGSPANEGSTAIYLGSTSTPDTYFNGSLDDVRIYNRALTTSEITRLYNMGSSKLGVTPTDSLDSGLVGHWDFDGKNVTSTTVLDTSGNGNTGTRAGNTTPTLGKIGQGMSFSVGSSITLPSALVPGTNDFTWSIWAQTSVAPAQRSIIDASGSSGWPSTGSISLYTHSAGFFVVYGDNGTFNTGGTSVTPRVGQWYHLVLRRSGASMQLYIDGVLKMSDSTAGANITAGNFKIGSNWVGSLDDARIYNRALSTDEITRLYNMGN